MYILCFDLIALSNNKLAKGKRSDGDNGMDNTLYALFLKQAYDVGNKNGQSQNYKDRRV